MLNTEHAYFEAGYKCARARLNRDEGTAKHWREWFTRAAGLEKPEDRAYAQTLFTSGYTEAQPARRPEHFR